MGGGTERVGGLNVLEATPGVAIGGGRGAEYGDGIDSVDERPEQGCAWTDVTVQLVVIR